MGAGLIIIVVFGLGNSINEPSAYSGFWDMTAGTVTLSSFFTAMLAAFWLIRDGYRLVFIGGEVKDANRIYPEGSL